MRKEFTLGVIKLEDGYTVGSENGWHKRRPHGGVALVSLEEVAKCPQMSTRDTTPQDVRSKPPRNIKLGTSIYKRPC